MRCSGQVGICGCKGTDRRLQLDAQLTSVGSPTGRGAMPGFRQTVPEQAVPFGRRARCRAGRFGRGCFSSGKVSRRDGPCARPCSGRSSCCHHSEWVRGSCCCDQPAASQSDRDGDRMRCSSEETDQISVRPISRHAGSGSEFVRMGAGARSPVRSQANSRRPGKFSRADVERIQPFVKSLYVRAVMSRYDLCQGLHFRRWRES